MTTTREAPGNLEFPRMDAMDLSPQEQIVLRQERTTAFMPEAAFFVHPSGLVETRDIGARTRVWAFAHILAGARIGSDCNICDHTFIENDVVVGNRVTVKSGVQLWDGIALEDDVFVGPNVTFTNDSFPRSRQIPHKFARTVVRRGASIGANATILPGLTIGSFAMVGAGSVVTRDVPPRAIVVGNPARVTGYVDTVDDPASRVETRCGQHPGAIPDEVILAGGVALCHLPLIADARGQLSFAQIGQSLPFAAARYFVIFGVPNREIRGEHAHRELHQFLICVRGSVAVRVFDGIHSREVQLNRPDLGLSIPPMIWTTQYKYSADAVLLVLASDVYREADYVRDLDEYLELRGLGQGGASSDALSRPAFGGN